LNYGYARVSTADQNLDLQLDALKEAGCEKIFTDKASGTKSDRPGLEEALSYMRKGDVLVVWKLDRLGRRLSKLIELVESLQEKGIGFKVLAGQGAAIDTTNPSGKLVFSIFAALAEYERELISERTKAGLDAARARGRVGGRPPKLDTNQILMLASMHKNRNVPIDDICATLNITRKTMYKYLGQARELLKEQEAQETENEQENQSNEKTSH